MNLAPIVLFVYNRPWHTRQTVEALQKNELAEHSEFFIFSDGPKNEAAEEAVREVRGYIRTISGFKNITIIEREKNWGLANSIINGVTEIITNFGSIIVLEDDLMASQYFLKYMNMALEFYRPDNRIMSISAYNHAESLMKFPVDYKFDIYMNYRNSSWGWGTWADRWLKVDWEIKDYSLFLKDKKKQMYFNRGGDDLVSMLSSQMRGSIDSWAIRFYYSHFLNQAYSIHPVKSYVNNIGQDGSGIHCNKGCYYGLNDLSLAKQNPEFINKIVIDARIMKGFRSVYRKRSLILRLLAKLSKLYKLHILSP